MKRNFYRIVSICVILSLSLIGCGNSTKNSKGNNNADFQSIKEEKAILKIFHFQQEGKSTFEKLIGKFEKENPDIKVDAYINGGGQYKTIQRSMFASRQTSDVVGVYPGVSQCQTLAKAGYLEDISGEPYIGNIEAEALAMGSLEGKTYALPIDKAYIAVFYNKEIFRRHDLNVPKTWNEFLNVCKKLKENSIIPLALGNRDEWVTQLIPYSLAPTMIYSKNIGFDKEMYNGKRKFNGPEWYNMIERYMELNTRGYFNNNHLDTTYYQQLDLFAEGKAGMMIMGTFAISLVRNSSSELELGVFVTPASDDGNNWVSSAVGGMLAIASDSKQKDAAKRFLKFFMEHENYKTYIEETKNFPTVKNMVAHWDPIAKELASEVTRRYNFLDQNWPAGVQEVMNKGLQDCLAGKSVKKLLTDMDNEFGEKKAYNGYSDDSNDDQSRHIRDFENN